jgi:hypothetical protein
MVWIAVISGQHGKGDRIMPLFFYFLLINILVRIGTGAVRKAREPKPDPLCVECSFVHLQRAVGGKRAISCTFGGGVRPITLNVMYCTDFRDRTIIPRPVVIGFAHELSEEATIAEAATAGR